jgi:YD repeat-containing protein
LRAVRKCGEEAGYTWDYENRHTSVTLPNGGGVVTFKYDPFGRRIQKSGPADTTNLLYDGANVVADVDTSGAYLARYVHGAGIDEPLSAITGTGTSFFAADPAPCPTPPIPAPSRDGIKH